jgi:hypothetical protein
MSQATPTPTRVPDPVRHRPEWIDGAPVLPLSPGGTAVLREALAALSDAGRRASAIRAARLPVPVLQALDLLEDPGIGPVAAAIRSIEGQAGPGTGLRARRRAVLRDLRRRHPDAMAGILAAMGAVASPETEDHTVVVHAYAWLIIVTIGVNGRLDHPFADPVPS